MMFWVTVKFEVPHCSATMERRAVNFQCHQQHESLDSRDMKQGHQQETRQQKTATTTATNSEKLRNQQKPRRLNFITYTEIWLKFVWIKYCYITVIQHVIKMLQQHRPWAEVYKMLKFVYELHWYIRNNITLQQITWNWDKVLFVLWYVWHDWTFVLCVIHDAIFVSVTASSYLFQTKCSRQNDRIDRAMMSCDY